MSLSLLFLYGRPLENFVNNVMQILSGCLDDWIECEGYDFEIFVN
jgi:hypothetical protein